MCTSPDRAYSVVGTAVITNHNAPHGSRRRETPNGSSGAAARSATMSIVDKADASRTAEEVLFGLRRETYDALVERLLNRSESSGVVGQSGARFQMEVQAFWDSRDGRNLRVVVSIDDGGLRAFAPLT